jgi:hypothetical protein
MAFAIAFFASLRRVPPETAMSLSRIFVVVDCTDSAESLSEQLRLRGFDARLSEAGVSDGAVVDLGFTVADGWRVENQIGLSEIWRRPYVVAAEGGHLRLLKPIAPSRLLSALRKLTAM